MNDRRRDDRHSDDRRPQDKALDRDLAVAADRYHEPPPTPREEMWARIQAVRTGEETSPADRRKVERMVPIWRRRTVLWPAAAAAVLLLGIAIGRISLPGDSSLPGPSSADRDLAHSGDSPLTGRDDVESLPEDSAPDQSIYRFAATPLLGRSEALLLQLTTGAGRAAGAQMFSTRAAALLAETRLLLDSPAAADADLKALLEDLELTLARVVTIATNQRAADQSEGGQAAVDRRVLEEGLDRKSIMPRLRSHLAAGSSPSSL